jgi:hypothetical protein
VSLRSSRAMFCFFGLTMTRRKIMGTGSGTHHGTWQRALTQAAQEGFEEPCPSLSAGAGPLKARSEILSMVPR